MKRKGEHFNFKVLIMAFLYMLTAWIPTRPIAWWSQNTVSRAFGNKGHEYLFKSNREYVLIKFEGTLKWYLYHALTGEWRNILRDRENNSYCDHFISSLQLHAWWSQFTHANAVKANNYVSRKSLIPKYLCRYSLCNNFKTRSNQSLLSAFELMLTRGREMQIDA